MPDEIMRKRKNCWGWLIKIFGELAEWLNAAVLKTVKDASPSGVRIPDSPHL